MSIITIMELPEDLRPVLEAAARLQELVPDAVLSQIVHEVQFGLYLLGVPVGAKGNPQDKGHPIAHVLVDKVRATFKTGDQIQSIFSYAKQPRCPIEYFAVADAYYFFSLHRAISHPNSIIFCACFQCPYCPYFVEYTP